MKKIKAMSLLSLLIIMSMIVVVMAASSPIITQNLKKISKGKQKAGEINIAGINGYFVCYYNATGNLCHKQVEFDANNNIKVIKNETCGVDCSFIVPDADSFEVVLVGGGGGGASTSVVNNFDSIVEGSEKPIGFIDGSITFSTSYFQDFEKFISLGNTKDLLNKILNGASVNVRRNNTNSDNACSKTASGIFLNNENDVSKISILDNGTVRNVDINGGANSFSADYTADLCSPSGVNSGTIKNAGDNYTILSSDLKEIVTETVPLKLKIVSYATELKMGEAGNPGEFRKFGVPSIGTKGQTIVFDPSIAEIGMGGDGGNATNINGKPGGKTTLKFDSVKMEVQGGSGGNVKDVKRYLENVKPNESGQNGIKSKFYIPDVLGIDESGLNTSVGSHCSKAGCSTINASTYPGSSGSGSGYSVGTDTYSVSGGSGGRSVDLNDKFMARVEVEYADSSYTKKGYFFPLGSSIGTYSYTNSTASDPTYNTLRPYLLPKTSNGGRGANGAILISW